MPAWWWAWYNVQSGQPAQVIQAPSASDVQSKTGFPPLAGPFRTRAEAQHWIDAGGGATSSPGLKPGGVEGPAGKAPPAPVHPADAALKWAVRTSGIAPWFFRGLKILFGGVLIIIGVSRLTGVDNAVTQLASKIKVIPV